jgi:hypothetical protein
MIEEIIQKWPKHPTGSGDDNNTQTKPSKGAKA